MSAPPRDPFSRMLDQVGQRRDEQAAHVRLRPVGNPGFQVQFTSEALEPATAETLGGLYVEELAYGEPETPHSSPPPTTTDPADIAAELALPTARTSEDLHRLRRRFALSNHPDRLDPGLREIATRRMMVANRLIDEAIAGKA